MAGASSAGSVASSPLPKWQLALAVGAPVALGLSYMYYKNSFKQSRGKTKNNQKKNGTTSDKQISIDGECPSASNSVSAKTETPLEKTQKLKNEGNNHFKIGKYDEAIAQYNNAIEACPKENTEELAILYQNRAAAYEQLNKYSSVKADCSKALELNPKYAKALIRRARVLDHCNDLEAALEDITTACILENFANQPALIMADRVLMKLGRQHATEHLATKKLVMPSNHFIRTYISTFSKDPVFTALGNENDNNVPQNFKKVLDAVVEQRYDDIIPLCTEQLNNCESDALPFKMEILLLRATFYLLLGQHDTAIDDFETIVNSDTASTAVKVNAFIKRATLYMQLENPKKSFLDFEAAARLDPTCGDIYHHRGQVHLLMEKIEEAKMDFEKAVKLNPNFGVAYAQKCYVDYRYGIMKRDVTLVTEATWNFEKSLEKFPNCEECYTLYAQILSEAQEYKKADAYFAKAIEIDPNHATVYVHRGLLQIQWNSNIDKAIKYINMALKLDDKCEFGYEALGTIEVQRGNLNEAIKLFDKALTLSRTPMEVTHIFSLRNAAKTQLKIKDKLGSHTVCNLQWNVS